MRANWGARVKITVITVCFNAEETIGDTLDSIAAQTHPDLEYIVVDGGSTDRTVDIVRNHAIEPAHLISVPDRGLYDAMNKGIRLATGEYIGYLHADDVFADPDAIARIVKAAEAKTEPVDLILSDIEYVERDNLSKRLRYYPAKGFTPEWLLEGDMPPQPGTYHRRDIYSRFGDYDLSFPISSDYDFFLRMFCIHKVSYLIVPTLTVRMRVGGKSSQGLRSNLEIWRDIRASARKHRISIGPVALLRKFRRKIFQLQKVRRLAFLSH